MGTIAAGINKKVIIAPQSTKGTAAVAGLATAQYIGRVTANFNLNKETYQSNRINTNQQVEDYRHGVISVDGTLNDELSSEAFELYMAAILRKDFVDGVSDSANSNVAIDASALTLTRDDALGSWLEDGFKKGDVISCTGFTATANNSVNFMIATVTDTVLSFIVLNGKTLTTETSGQAITTTVLGQKTWIPETGHTENWFTAEEYYSDIDLSDVYYDLKVSTMAVKMPASGLATIDFGFMGLNYDFLESSESPYFTDPLEAIKQSSLASSSGIIMVEGVQVALITSLDFDVSSGFTGDPVAFSNIKPDLYPGKVAVKGSMSVFYQDATFRDYFADETEASIAFALTETEDDDANFMAFAMSRIKVGGANKDDGEKGLIQTLPFVALFDTNAGDATGADATDTLATTLSIQDSTL